MVRRKKIPAYRLHRQSDQAVVTLPDPSGSRRDYLLGKYGSPESRVEYARVIAEWETNSRRVGGARMSDITVAELLVAFLEHAETHYRRPDGSATSELGNFKLAFRPVKALYAHTLAVNFGPVALRAVRERMVQAGAARKTINKWVNRLRHVWKWGASHELVPASAYESLRTLPPLEAGRTKARDLAPVKPVPSEDVDATLPFLRPQTRAIVELLRVTGMRPGEAVQVRPADLDRTGDVWLYRPQQHKTRWRELERSIAIGPRGQEILKPFLKRDAAAYLFSPREATRQLWESQRLTRKSRVFPSQVRDWAKRLKAFGDFYTVTQLDTAIKRACIKAKVPHWSANRLRHLHGTNIRRQYGLEAAQTALGHQRADVTQIYAERNIELAKRIAAEVG